MTDTFFSGSIQGTYQRIEDFHLWNIPTGDKVRMGQLKHQTSADTDNHEHRWNYIAHKKGHACSACGEIPPYAEREIYFATKMCGPHAHLADKQARRD